MLFLKPLGDDDSPALPLASEVRRGINDLLGDALEDMELDDFFTPDEETAVVLEDAEYDDFLLVTSEVAEEYSLVAHEGSSGDFDRLGDALFRTGDLLIALGGATAFTLDADATV